MTSTFFDFEYDYVMIENEQTADKLTAPANSEDIALAGSMPAIVPENEVNAVDRKAIRKSRKGAAKQAKQFVRSRYQKVLDARPPGSQPADKILRAAVTLYRDGPLRRRDLKSKIFNLEATIRKELPDFAVMRSPRTASISPARVGLMIYETRAVIGLGDRIVSAENHAVVLEEDRIVFVSGHLPGGTRPHLFERVFEREGRDRTMADILLQLSDLWPTLLWMRAEQRMHGRGTPIQVMMTPFGDGLLFGSLDKVEGLPPAGPIVAICTTYGQQTRQVHDYYADGNGTRMWAGTNTFVDAALLGQDQLLLRDILSDFLREFSDVVADNNWRWRIGLGTSDPAVAVVASTFKLTIPTQERRTLAFDALETIVMSDRWQTVAAETLLSQQRRSK